MERDQVIQVGRLRGIERFENEIQNFVFNTFIYFKPVKRFENKSGVSEFRSFDNGTSKGVLDLLDTMYLRLGNIVVVLLQTSTSHFLSSSTFLNSVR